MDISAGMKIEFLCDVYKESDNLGDLVPSFGYYDSNIPIYMFFIVDIVIFSSSNHHYRRDCGI